VAERTSLGQMRGVITVASPDPATVQRSLREALDSIHVEVT